MTPDFEVLAAGINITSQVKDRLMSLTVTDEAGFKSDAVAISLDDRDGEVELPFPGAPLVVAMGYEETFLMPMGLYTSDEVVMKGMPATLTIRGKAADMGGSIKEQKTRSWDENTIREIVEEIAAEHGLEAQVAEVYADFFYEHLDQTDESDINFLTRIGKDHDAIVSVKGGALLFMGKGEGKTALGLPMIPRFIYRTGKTTYSATLANRENFKTVEAFWHDHKTGERQKVTEGEGAPIKRLRHNYPNEKEAKQAAKAKLDEMKRGNDTLTVTLPGDPFIAAEGQIIAIGFRVGIDGLWSVKSVTHAITGSGYKTTIRCEKPKSEGG
jgi:phage protein D